MRVCVCACVCVSVCLRVCICDVVCSPSRITFLLVGFERREYLRKWCIVHESTYQIDVWSSSYDQLRSFYLELLFFVVIEHWKCLRTLRFEKCCTAH